MQNVIYDRETFIKLNKWDVLEGAPIPPWAEGGKTDISILQMLCKEEKK
ncbi:hypothetical protein ACYULU_01820 [Breznakiellaceae bacterium SP9]